MGDPFVTNEERLPRDFKYFRDRNLRELAKPIATAYALPIADKNREVALYDMGFRGWELPCEEPIKRVS